MLEERMEEEVLDKCKDEDSKKEAYRGVYVEAGSATYENGEKIVGQEPSLFSESIACSVSKASVCNVKRRSQRKENR